jgi:hypothetical protein
MITAEAVRAALTYCPDTGLFKRRDGSVAGDVKPTGYRYIGVCGQRYRAHRLAWFYMYGEWPKGEIDHINRNRDDNRIDNLRDVSRSLNCKNTALRRDNTSGRKGIYWYGDRLMWRASISIDGRLKHLGWFDTKEKAIAAREANEKLHGYLAA